MVRSGVRIEGRLKPVLATKFSSPSKGKRRKGGSLPIILWVPMLHILIVEDEPSIADTLVYALQTEGYQVTWAMTAQKAMEVFAGQVDGVVLDVGLPDANGFEVCREMRKLKEVPILFLTARSSEVDKVVGLEIGADDYVVKPFSPREVTARLRAILRRYKPSSSEPQPAASRLSGESPESPRRPGLADFPEQCRMEWNGLPLELSAMEYKLLSLLNRNRGRVFSRKQLMDSLWESPGASMERTIDTHIKSIRMKLREVAPEEEILVTHRGFGYSAKP
jgi:two-component system, OmpR family, catabolic regulation response regulator CreB